MVALVMNNKSFLQLVMFQQDWQDNLSFLRILFELVLFTSRRFLIFFGTAVICVQYVFLRCTYYLVWKPHTVVWLHCVFASSTLNYFYRYQSRSERATTFKKSLQIILPRNFG